MKMDEIAQLYDLKVVVERFGVKLKGAGWGMCPFPSHIHRENTPSFSVYNWRGRQRFKCHGNCGLKGDVIDFYGYMFVPGYSPGDLEHRKLAAEALLNGRVEICPPKIEKKATLLPEFLWEDFLPVGRAARDYLFERGLTGEEIERYRLGSATRIEEGRPVKTKGDELISIPTFHAGSLVGIKVRIIRPRSKYKYFSVENSRAGMWNYDRVNGTTGVVLIMKGEFCGMVANKRFLACAMVSGEAGTTPMLPLWGQIRSALASAKKIVIGDNDEPGRKYGPIRAELFDAALKFPPGRYKDFDQWWLADKDECEEMTQEWVKEAGGE